MILSTSQITEWYNAGLTPVPVIATEKRPALKMWRDWIENRPSLEMVQMAFSSNPHTGVGLITGTTELIDIDVKYDISDVMGRFDREFSRLYPDLYAKMVIEISPSGGMHYWYNIDEEYIDQNRPLTIRNATPQEKVANSKLKHITVIETRGYGGQGLCAPTPGYQIIQSEFSKIAKISPQERLAIWEIAFGLSEQIVQPEVTEAPGRAFNDGVSVSEIVSLLQRHGWRELRHSTPGKIYFNRPGAKHPNAVDADILVDRRKFHVFSTSTGFEPGSNSFFHVYAMLEHRGNHQEAAKALRQQGWGVTQTTYNVAMPMAPAMPGLPELPEPVQPDYVFDLDLKKPKPSIVEAMTNAEFEAFVKSVSEEAFNGKDENFNLFVETNPTPLSRQQIGIGFKGALIPIFGQQKSRKTTLLGSIVTANYMPDKMWCKFHFDAGGPIMWVDTEQGIKWYKETIRRIMIPTGQNQIEGFWPFRVKKMSFLDRIRFIDRAAQFIKPAAIIIDGIKDLGVDYNDLKESTFLSECVGLWQEYGATIFPILHLTKGDKTPRGHLGNTLLDKCDAAISIEPLDNRMIEVRHYISRGPKFDPFCLIADGNNVLHTNDYKPTIETSDTFAPARPDVDEDIPF